MATWNPADKHGWITLSGGNLIATRGVVSPHWVSVRSTNNTPIQNNKKWYWEYTILDSLYKMVGVSSLSANIKSSYVGSTPDSVGWNLQNGAIHHNGSSTPILSTYGSGDIIMVAFDPNVNAVWFGKNGIWEESGDPVNGSNPIRTGLVGDYVPAVCFEVSNSSVKANFGAYAFNYPVPIGFGFDPTYKLITDDTRAIRGYTKDATVNSTYADTVMNSALDFDGNDILEFPYTDACDPGAGDFTACTWFKITNTATTTHQRLFGRREGAAGWTIETKHYGTADNFNNTIIEDSSGNKFQFVGNDNYNVFDGKWHHVAITWSASAQAFKLYVDGIFKENGALVNGPTVGSLTNNTSVKLGGI